MKEERWGRGGEGKGGRRSEKSGVGERRKIKGKQTTESPQIGSCYSLSLPRHTLNLVPKVDVVQWKEEPHRRLWWA